LSTSNIIIRGQLDNYSITSKLAEGGMGSVHYALNSKRHQVIVKAPLVAGDMNDDLRIEKLKIEATILRDIQNYAHQNSIVKYIDETPPNASFHLIIEKVEGKNLQDVVANRPMDEKTALDSKTDIDSTAKTESSSTGLFLPTSLNNPILGLDEKVFKDSCLGVFALVICIYFSWNVKLR